MQKTYARQKWLGFTLIEVLIALVILAVVASLAMVGLQAVVQTDRRQIEITDQLAELQFAYMVLQRDISQAVDRSIVDGLNEYRPGWLGVHDLQNSILSDIPLKGQIILEFTRVGVPNPLQLPGRSTLQRVAYVYDGENLLRYEWEVLDRTLKSVVVQRTLLTHITDLKLVYFNRYREPSFQWATVTENRADWLGVFAESSDLPMAVEWRFMHPRYGELVWLFLANEAPSSEAMQNKINL